MSDKNKESGDAQPGFFSRQWAKMERIYREPQETGSGEPAAKPAEPAAKPAEPAAERPRADGPPSGAGSGSGSGSDGGASPNAGGGAAPAEGSPAGE